MHVLEGLLAIFRQFERLQTPGEARQACAEVAVFLNNALIQEQISANLRQKKQGTNSRNRRLPRRAAGHGIRAPHVRACGVFGRRRCDQPESGGN